MSLAEKMRQSKSNVESRISEVNYLVIEQNKFVSVYESVLRTEIAVNQTFLVLQRFSRQCIEESSCCANVLGGVKVVWLQSKALEVGGVRECFRDFRSRV